MAGLTTTTQITTPVNVVFQETLLRNAKPLCPYFTGSVAAEVQEHKGTFTAKWRRIENLTPVSSALAELTGSVAFPTRTPDQPTITDLTATVSKFGNYLMLNEEVDLVNFSGQMDKLMEILGINAGQSLNRQQRNVMEDEFTIYLQGTATTATGLSGAPTASGFINRTGVAAVTNAIERQNALKFRPMTTGNTNIGTTPVRDSFWGICHVDVGEDLRLVTGFNSVETYANQTDVAQGEIGHLGGVRFVVTTEATIDTGTGVASTGSATDSGRSTSNRYDVYNTVIYGRDAVGSVGFGFEHIKETYTAGDKLPGVMVISHARGSAGSADPLNEISTIGWKSWHAAEVLNTNWGRTFRHVARILDPAE